MSIRIRSHQVPMCGTVQGNLDQVIDALEQGGADLHLFPECTLTGYHRGLPNLVDSEALAKSTELLQRIVDRTGAGVVVGRPLRTSQTVLNAMLLLAPGQAPQWTAKRGLTPSEVRFFSPPVLGEVGHPGQLLFQGRRFGVVFCREILDPLEHLAGADALLWPGCIQWDEDDNYERAASAHCLRLGVPLLQANWADAINAPQISGMGGSFLLDTQGAVFRRAALDSADLLTLEFFWRQTP